VVGTAPNLICAGLVSQHQSDFDWHMFAFGCSLEQILWVFKQSKNAHAVLQHRCHTELAIPIE
jgi:hypothetical protein